MKYPTPKTTIECSVPGCSFWDEIELVMVTKSDIWVMPEDWDDDWTVNEDGGAVCPNHDIKHGWQEIEL